MRVFTLPAIGALAMTARALTRVDIKSLQARWRNAGKIEKLQCPHAQDRAPHAFDFPASRRSNHPAAQTCNHAPVFQLAAKGDVFHQRQIRIAAHLLEYVSPHKDRLIAGANFGQTRAVADHPTDHFEHALCAVKLDVKAPADDARITKRSGNIREGRRRQPGVGMKKQETLAKRLLSAAIHLARPTARRSDDFYS